MAYKKLYLCFVAEDFATPGQAAAASSATADATDTEVGCKGHAWTLLTKQ